MATIGVEVTGVVYLSFVEGIGDHLSIYIDVDIISELGSDIPLSTKYIS